MHFSLIAAADSNMGIGKNGHLPWRLPSDLAYYHAKTVGKENNAVIMGRLTWESLPTGYRPLPKRRNIVITRNKEYELPKEVLRTESLEEALSKAAQSIGEAGASPSEVFVIGGAQIFAEAIHHPNCAKIYLTEIDGEFGCDTFFPKIDPSCYQKTQESETKEENGIRFRFSEYHRMD